jgi:hypothetical protein
VSVKLVNQFRIGGYVRVDRDTQLRGSKIRTFDRAVLDELREDICSSVSELSPRL